MVEINPRKWFILGTVIDIPKKMGISIDFMVEAKMKEQAIFRLYEKYGQDGFLKMWFFTSSLMLSFQD